MSSIITSQSPLLESLQWRGLIHQCTDFEGLSKSLQATRCVYAGFDPTSDSLHVGSLLPLTLLRRFQKAGHRPIALVGGATGMVGDPSGKSDERNLLDKDTLARNVAGMKQQMQKFLDFEGPNAALIVNNLDWMQEFSFLDFLRDVGKNFPVNVMLSKDSVKSRLERTDSGLSYTEFSYMLLQAYDFAYLARTYQCELQIGGSDQWGNITAGIDLARRMQGMHLFGLTCPLLLTSDGRKMGKTEQGAVWLSEAKTSPYAFYQYFYNVEDADVIMTLRFLSDVDRDEIQSLEKATLQRPHERAAQVKLAESLTELVHGTSGLHAAQLASKILFGAEIDSLDDRQLGEIFSHVTSSRLGRSALNLPGLNIIDALLACTLAKSRGDARRMIEQGGVYINNRRIENEQRMLLETDLASQSMMVLRTGKKKYALLQFE